jgi:uracil-DNA glycosylase
MASPDPRPIIVGQAPGPNTDPLEPLSGRSGARLAELCGITHPEFLARFDRRNLLPKFPGRSGGKGDAW